MELNVTSISNKWLTRFRSNLDARVRLICFPYAGGGASIYRNWHQYLPSFVELLAVQLPGRETRMSEKPFNHFEDIIDTAYPYILPYLDLPYALFGHSMGAILSFELARRLYASNQPLPMFVAVSARGAPRISHTDPPSHNLPDREFLEEIRRLSGTPEAVLQEPELMELLLPLLRADFTVGETYQYVDGPPLPCPILVFGGLGDLKTGTDALQSWHQHTVGDFTLQMLPGDHFFIHTCRQRLLEILVNALRRCEVQRQMNDCGKAIESSI